MATVTGSAPRRVDAIDGLRTLAVVAVIGVHVGLSRLAGGSIGVDVFFVISGFVITGVLLRELDLTGTVSIRRFYLRRLLRLWPVLALACLAAVILYVLLPNGVFGVHAGEIPSALFYVMDFTSMKMRLHAPMSATLAQTWSLGIEEQFYLVWAPLFLLVAVRLRSLRALQWITVLVIVAVIVERFLLWKDPVASLNRIYNGPDARADQLMIGCLLAIVMYRRPELRASAGVRRALHLLVPVAAAFLVVIVSLVPIVHDLRYAHFYFTAGMTVVALAAATVVAGLVILEHHPLTRLLRARWLSVPGRQWSYSMYIWHYPITFGVKAYLHTGAAMTFAIVLTATVCAAIVTRALVEDRFDAIRARLETAKTIPADEPPMRRTRTDVVPDAAV
jgi:peptidoglycan/LPS O-acetylase OafA/YrhL